MYAVIGPTGNTGSVVIRELRQHGADVRAIVRTSARAQQIVGSECEIAVADLRDGDALTAALRGVSGLYAMLPPAGEGDDLLAANRPMADALAQAVARAGVPHVVLLSSVGAEQTNGTGPIASNHYLERVLSPAAKALTALRPPYFMDNWSEALGTLEEGKLYTLLPTELAIPMISTEDIGRIAATCLREGPRGREVIALEGPSSYSASDVARALSSITGRPVEPVYVPYDAVVPTLTAAGLGPRTAELYREMYQAIEQGRVVQETTVTRTLRGVVALEQALRTLLARAPA